MAQPRTNSRVLQARRQRVAAILPLLRKLYPGARCSLDYRNPLELLVATILSAQSTDVRVNLVTPALFKTYRTARDYAEAPQAQLERAIHSTGFYRNKARSLRGLGQALVERFGGKVPQTMQDLTGLPGVGRKTANVVLGNAFDQNLGVVVDTHVTRVANRLGLTRHPSDAVKIERDLMEVVPQAQWTLFSHLLIFHGRQICHARKPRCTQCPLLAHCPAGPKLIKAGKAAAGVDSAGGTSAMTQRSQSFEDRK